MHEGINGENQPLSFQVKLIQLSCNPPNSWLRYIY